MRTFCGLSELDNPIWIKKRGSHCERCGKGGGLQVHHKVYRAGMRPWEYSDSDLMCLCPECHLQLHQSLADAGKKIPVLDGGGKPVSIPDDIVCFECLGTGIKEDWKYLMGGICFRCFGTGIKGSHYFTPLEALRYSYRFFNDWEKKHRREDGTLNSTKFSGPEDVKKWFLEEYGEKF